MPLPKFLKYDADTSSVRALTTIYLSVTADQFEEAEIVEKNVSISGPFRVDAPEHKISGTLMLICQVNFKFYEVTTTPFGATFVIKPGMKVFDSTFVINDAEVLNYLNSFFSGSLVGMNYDDIIRGFIAVQETHNFIPDYPLSVASTLFAIMVKDHNGVQLRRNLKDPKTRDFIIEKLKAVPRKAGAFSALSFEDIVSATTSSLAMDMVDKREELTTLQEKLVFHQQKREN